MASHRDPASWGERLSDRFLRFIPAWIYANPERALINLICILSGIAVLFPLSTSFVAYTWGPILRLEWGLGMIAGGILSLWGAYSNRRSIARLGILLIAICATFFATSAWLALGWRATVVGLAFSGIALAKIIRLAVSSTARAHLLRRHNNEDSSDG